ncbi:MAG TPA: hypothetical protein VFW07_27065 [Parafilimonas sp.]|nr:hypothetical protein [Parafilimonas sp.]
MKKIIFALLALMFFLHGTAQSTTEDTSMHATAIAVCDCLTKANLAEDASEEKIQQAFLNCLFTSAPDLVGKIAGSGDDYMAASQELGTKLMMEMMKNGCPAFMKLATAMADGGDMQLTMPSQVQTVKLESTDGTVVKVEERDFTYITLKNTAGRELIFIYYSYVPGSDDWIKDAVTKLKNKNVSISYVESEVYQPKYKQFMNVKEIKTLTIK